MAEVGKRVLDELYVHLSALNGLALADHRLAIERALARLPAGADSNVAKLNVRSGRVSLLSYPGFDQEPYPTLETSWAVSREPTAPPVFRSYESSLNPPVLHRKELLVGLDHPQRQSWEQLTRQAEELGLFDQPATIGFRMNWERLVASIGYTIRDHQLVPLGHDLIGELDEINDGPVHRHRTALHRQALSAPIQLLMRHGVVTAHCSVFDYGCGRGGDIAGLLAGGIKAQGWDPHYAPDHPLVGADVVNLGFVINVIEDPAERVHALQSAYQLATKVLAVSVMLTPSQPAGKRFGDGYLTSRRTFQKYFSQGELRDFIEHAIHREPHMVGPGIALVFVAPEAEQRFFSDQYRTSDVARRLTALKARELRHPAARALREGLSRVPRPRENRAPRPSRYERCKPLLDIIWREALELGRAPEADEVSIGAEQLAEATGTLGRAWALIRAHYDMSVLDRAAKVRRDDLLLLLCVQAFSKKTPYARLEQRLQRDVRASFGSYEAAREEASRLLSQAGSRDLILQACREAASDGLGFLNAEHSLQLAMSLTERLPVLLRAYIACSLVLWDSASDVDVVKIHITSGKLTLLEHDDFDKPIPELRRRVKVNLRRLDYSVFEYGVGCAERSWLFPKSQVLHEEMAGYVEQTALEERLRVLCGVQDTEHLQIELPCIEQTLRRHRLEIQGTELVASTSVPDLEEPCGGHHTFRDFVECGQTQQRLAVPNVPLNPQTYNALHQLAIHVLDPLIEYFGSIELTYGFCSPQLARCISSRVDPKLDQHASCEFNARGQPVCVRGGAACDFLVRDEDMREVAGWVTQNIEFDRLYFYGEDKPLHVSYSPTPVRQAYEMSTTRSGRLIPRPLDPQNFRRGATTRPAIPRVA